MERRFITVDGDSKNIENLTVFFKKYGIENDSASSVDEAKKKIEGKNYDIAILEVILPDGGGIELTKWIKEKKGIPVILLTTLNEAIDTAIGLEIGADDYIHKPFDFRVLLARINALLRIYEISNIEKDKEQTEQTEQSEKINMFNIKRRALVIDGVDIALNSTEFSFMRVLIENQGKSVTRERLFEVMFEKPWNPEDRAVDNIVNRIRKKIEKQPDNPKYIITVRHKGYLIPEGVILLIDNE